MTRTLGRYQPQVTPPPSGSFEIHGGVFAPLQRFGVLSTDAARRRVSTLLVLLVGVACHDPLATNDRHEPTRVDASSLLMQSPPATLNLDEEFEQIARTELPGFAGYFIDSSQRVVVSVKGGSRSALAQRVGERVAARMRMANRSVAANPVVRSANYSVIELLRWREAIDSATSGIGELASDLDEVRNQVWIAVEDVRSKPGDSGAPILLLNPPNPGLGIAGVLYGGPNGVWSETWFTTLQGIERDLGGTLAVCLPSWGC